MSLPPSQKYRRHARMAIKSLVLISRGDASWPCEIENISATGVLLERPQNCTPEIGEHFVLDLLIGDDLTIHLEATVARVTPEHLGFAYARIPEAQEASLWNLLGRYADDEEIVEG
ncbi:MAG: PilZ domain-containing protein [Dokdonella sp.]